MSYCYLETILKIYCQNTKIISKLDTIISNQQALTDRLAKVENICNKNNDNNNGGINVDFIKKITKEIADKLLETCIYPTPEEMRKTTDIYMNEKYETFMNQFKRPERWMIYYEKHVASPVSIKQFYINF